MSKDSESSEGREQELEKRIQMLEKHLEQLSSHVNVESNSAHTCPDSDTAHVKLQKKPLLVDPADDMPELSEEVLGWAARNSVLPRLATICFLMVVALILRTITDSGLVGKLPGSVIGMLYAAGLMSFAWFKYQRESPLAPIFAACGIILMSSIILETHVHFQALPLVPAYFTLMATGLGMAIMSHRFNVLTPISVGVLGMCFAGAAIDYPHPFFPYLSLVLFTANVLGFFATRLKRCSWLRWSVLVVTLIMFQLWGIRLSILLSKNELPTPELAAKWYLPVIAVFFVTFMLLSFLGILNSGKQKISRFDFSLPTINVIWAFMLTKQVVEAWQMNVTILGIIGLIAASVLLGITFWCAHRNIEGSPGTNTFVFAAAVLIALSLPAATTSFLLSLPVISIIAITMAIVSRVWENGGIRGTTYVMNLYASAALVLSLRGEAPAVNEAINILPAGVIAFTSIYHYEWCRKHQVPSSSVLFDFFDRNDVSAVLLLFGGLASGFVLLKIALFQALPFIELSLQRDSFRCGQSVIINGSAICLIAVAYFRQNKELRNVAILVTIIGAIKVFLYDLLGTHGVPLVLSVFSFGVAAAVESLALGKWQKTAIIDKGH